MFTGLAYLYMCLCFYLFFVGLILLYTVIHDFWSIGEAASNRPEVDYQHEFHEAGLRVMRAIFRCTVLGLLIAIVMKLQSAYLTSRGENIVSWLGGDMSSAFNGRNDVSAELIYRRPTHYSSLLIAISTCVVFVYGSIRLGVERRFYMSLCRMSAIVALLVAGYLLIDAFAGFSILLGVGLLFAMYGLFDPGLGRGQASK